MKRLVSNFNDALRNPFFIFLFTVVISIGLIYFEKVQADWLGVTWQQVINTIAGAVLISGTLGLWFDLIGKENLIKDTVRDAVGQTRAVESGITDVVIKVTSINESQDFIQSAELVIGIMRSAKLLDRYREEVRTRLSSGKTLTIVRMEDASMFPSASGYGGTPDDFVKSLKAEPAIMERISVLRTNQIMSYNFVKSDRGIWIKMYFNAAQPDLSPAFFLKKGGILYDRFSKDIEILINESTEVTL